LLVPFAHPAVPAHIAESLDLYVRLFEFNAGPYYLLKEIGGWWTGEDVSKTLGPALRVVFLAGLVAVYALDGRRRWPLAWAWALVLGWLWATATTVHPWYLLGVLALLPFTLGPDAEAGARWHAAAWCWLALAAMATYLFYSAGSTPYWIAVWVGWGGWAVLVATGALHAGLPALMRRRAAAKWRWLQPHLGSPPSLLDLGAGEGYVGEWAARETGAKVVLADVVDFNQTELPMVRYGGNRLPFADGAFDATLLVFVLHHSEAPLGVLREARRVTDGRVAVVESVVENELDRRWLVFADRLANRLRSGGRMREEELHFGTVEEWREWFRTSGFEVVAEERRGRWLHKRHLFVLE
jgi:ubiquinone/menaquinone biosynthesis C-methylase UbiE